MNNRNLWPANHVIAAWRWMWRQAKRPVAWLVSKAYR